MIEEQNKKLPTISQNLLVQITLSWSLLWYNESVYHFLRILLYEDKGGQGVKHDNNSMESVYNFRYM